MIHHESSVFQTCSKFTIENRLYITLKVVSKTLKLDSTGARTNTILCTHCAGLQRDVLCRCLQGFSYSSELLLKTYSVLLSNEDSLQALLRSLYGRDSFLASVRVSPPVTL